jgi:hypothetical protein
VLERLALKQGGQTRSSWRPTSVRPVVLFPERRRACGERLPSDTMGIIGRQLFRGRWAAVEIGPRRRELYGPLFDSAIPRCGQAPAGRWPMRRPGAWLAIAATWLSASSCILDTAAFDVRDFVGELRLHLIELVDRKIV